MVNRGGKKWGGGGSVKGISSIERLREGNTD